MLDMNFREYNTRIRLFFAEPHPKAGRGYGGVRSPPLKVLYDVLCGPPHRGLWGIGVGLSVLHRVRAKHTPDLFYSPLGLSLTRTGRSAAGFFFAFWRFGTILNGFFF